MWDRETGVPVYNAIVWQDRRTAGYTDQLKKDGKESIVKDKTGKKPYTNINIARI